MPPLGTSVPPCKDDILMPPLGILMPLRYQVFIS